MSRPSDELLSQYASLSIWREAERQAERSPHKRFRTGAVIFDGMGMRKNIYSTGTAHPHGGGRRTFSVHAETHAVSRLPRAHGGAVCLLITLTKAGNYATCSRPCLHCAKLLSRHVWGVIYAELCNDGSWAIRKEPVENLFTGFLKDTKLTT